MAVRVVDRKAYLATSKSLLILDASDPARPVERAVYRRATAARALAVSGPYVFLAAGYQGLQVLEVPDANGSTSSDPAHLTVNQPMVISAGGQLTNWFSMSLGASVTNRVIVTATPPVTYQWRWNGVALPDKTSNSIVLTNLQIGDEVAPNLQTTGRRI